MATTEGPNRSPLRGQPNSILGVRPIKGIFSVSYMDANGTQCVGDVLYYGDRPDGTPYCRFLAPPMELAKAKAPPAFVEQAIKNAFAELREEQSPEPTNIPDIDIPA